MKMTEYTDDQIARAAVPATAGRNEAPLMPAVQAARAIVSIRNVSKTYASGLQALKPINLDIRKGEIFALLGPNGAGKTTLINIICGIVTPTTGMIAADGLDIQRDFRGART